MNILREPEVCARTKRSRVTIWRMERAGLFPKRLQIGANAVGWLEGEVNEWISSRERGFISAESMNILRSRAGCKAA